MKKLENEQWYQNLNINNGIWIGDGITNQSIIKTENIKVYDANENFNGLSFNIKDGKYEIIKIIGTTEVQQKDGDTIKNKVFIKLIVPEIDKEYDLYLPVNKKIGNIVILLNESINELTNGELELSNNNKLYNSKTKEYYSSDVLLINTNIRNGSTLVLTS